MADSDPSPEQLKEVYARFGLAIYLCQCVERQLATLLATKYGPGVRNLTQSQYDELLRSLFKNTFGGLLKRLRDSADVSDDLETTLGTALEYRNWLAHNYFWERAGHHTTANGCSYMIRELQGIVDFLNHFEIQLSTVLSEWTGQNGVSQEMVEREMEKLSEDAKDDF